jgi:DNA-binding FadR family transcriptional regulator
MTQIVRGTAAAGELLPPEPELCLSLGVSRTVVREALGVLASKGLVTVEHGRGTRVNDPRKWNSLDPGLIQIRQESGVMGQVLDELLEVRRIVEVELAALAAERATNVYLQEMQGAIQAMLESGGEIEAYLTADLRFHEALALAAGNSLLHSIWVPVSMLLQVGVRLGATGRNIGRSYRTHQGIYAAVERKDKDSARAATQAVVLEFEKNIRQALPH